MPLSTAEIRNIFRRPVVPVDTTPHYRLRLLSVLAGLATLQLLYLALVGAVFACTIGYMVLGLGIMVAAGFNFLMVILYLGPPVAGAIAVLFLLKPIFLRAPKPPAALELRAEDEPLLFELVEQLCDALGSPRPSRIFADLKVNASASVHGWRGFFLGRFDLTLGLPLVTGLTLAQFTGVLAHEFGHFAQRAGLRSYFLIGQIRTWFARVVIQRDSWDIGLERRCASRDPRVKGVAHLARLVVNISRWYLSLLMKAGQWIGAGFSRQMEFDADRREASIVGPEVFEQTTLRLPVLQLASRLAYEDADREWAVRRLPEDLPALMEARASLLPEETIAALRGGVLEARTGRWDTHPCARARIDNAKTVEGGGIFDLQGPAQGLFGDIDGLRRRVTQHHYQTIAPKPKGTVRFLPTQQMIGNTLATLSYEEAVGELFHAPVLFCAKWFQLEGRETAEAEGGLDQEDFEAAVKTSIFRYAALQVVSAGVRIQPASFGLAGSALEEVRSAEAASAHRLDALMSRMNAAARPLALRMEAAYHGIRTGQLAVVVPARRPVPIPDLEATWRCYAAMAYSQGAVMAVRRRLHALSIVQQNSGLFKTAVRVDLLERLHAEAMGTIEAILARLGDIPAVVTFDDRAGTAATQLMPEGLASDRIEIFLSRYETMCARALAQLAWFTTHTCPAPEAVTPGGSPDATGQANSDRA